MPDFYYQIKGKKYLGQFYGSGFSENWVFPPIFSGKVIAADKKEAKVLIEEEYGKQFPLRVLKKDLDSNEFLLKIEDMTGKNYLAQLFEERPCKECKSTFRRIDLYNDPNTRYKGTEYCCDACKERAYERQRFELSESMFSEAGNVPCIYKITNRTTGQCYIGQTIQSFTLRWWQHIKWGKTDCKFHKAMQESKITDWIFEVIEIIESKDKLNDREGYWIKFYNSVNGGYNTVRMSTEDTEQMKLTEVTE